MSQVTIRSCPVCPTISSHTHGAVKALKSELGVDAKVIDGVKGEFTILVDNRPVFQKTSDSLPSMEQVVDAVRRATPARV